MQRDISDASMGGGYCLLDKTPPEGDREGSATMHSVSSPDPNTPTTEDDLYRFKFHFMHFRVEERGK